MAKDNNSLGGAFPPDMARGRAAPKANPAQAPAAPAPAHPESVMGRVAGRGSAALKRLDASKLAIK